MTRANTDEDPGLRIESFAVINLCGVSTNKTIIKELVAHFNEVLAPFVLEKQTLMKIPL
jgi:hypothetical protein